MTIHLRSQEEFDALLEEYRVVLADFYADWCGPCRMMTPVLEQLAEIYEGRAAVAKINCDEMEALAAEFGVMSIPTFILFQNGAPVKTFVGGQSLETLEAALDAELAE